VWKQSGISLKTKAFLYRTTMMTTRLYGAESWTCTQNEYARLNAFHTKRLRILAGKKRDEIRNVDLLKRAEMQPLENYVRYYRLRWAGHVRRMDDGRGRPLGLWTQVYDIFFLLILDFLDLNPYSLGQNSTKKKYRRPGSTDREVGYKTRVSLSRFYGKHNLYSFFLIEKSFILKNDAYRNKAHIYRNFVVA